MVPSLPLQLPLEAALILAGIGLFLLAAGVREAIRAVRLRRTAPTPIVALDDASGRVVVTGIARRADRTVTAPFTGRDCLAYSWRVDAVTVERGPDGVRHRRDVVDRGRGAVPFLVDDRTGTVPVDPGGAELRLAEAWVEDYDPDPADRGDPVFGTGAFPGWEQYDPHYYEARLDEGETVSVHGTVGPDADELRAGRVGIRIAGRGTLVSDVDDETMARRSLRAAVVSIVLGVIVMAALAFLWTTL
jgi:hypothetical protein